MKSANEQDVINPEITSVRHNVDAYRERWARSNAYYCEGFSSAQMEMVIYLIGQAYLDGRVDGLRWTPRKEAV